MLLVHITILPTGNNFLGDILVFLTGQEEIDDTCEALEKW